MHFRDNVPSIQQHGGLHGIMICALPFLKPLELMHMKVPGLESRALALDTGHGRLVVVVIYRPPSLSANVFLERLDNLLSLLPLNVPTVVMGDFNACG